MIVRRRRGEGGHWLAFFGLLLLLLLLVACDGEGEIPAALATLVPPPEGGLATVGPTPTLLPELAAVTRPPRTPFPTATPAPPTPTPTKTPLPTPTPAPVERIGLGAEMLVHENFDMAARHFQAALSVPGALSQSQQEEALWGLSRAYLAEGRYAEAADTLNGYLALARVNSEGEDGEATPGREPAAARPSPALQAAEEAVAYFHLGQAHQGAGSCEAAIDAYRVYLDANPEMAAYVQPRIAACNLVLEDEAGAVAAYEAALTAGAHRLTEIEIRQQLADYYLEAEAYEQAVAQYDAIRELAVTENTRGAMTYLAGNALLQAGEETAAYERYRAGVQNYPQAYESYLGLVALVDAGHEVDPFQRGLVDYYAGAYEPAVSVFSEYLEAPPADYRADAHLYLAWSYEALGNLEAALAQLDAYAVAGAEEGDAGPHAAEAEVERGKLYARAGETESAIAAYLDVVERFPESEEAAFAAYWAAILTEEQGELAQATDLYRQLATNYPSYEEAPRALFRVGLLNWEAGDEETAVTVWEQLVDSYPERAYGAAGLIWLMRVLPPVEAEPYVITATQLSAVEYYPLRARERAEEIEPFARTGSLLLESDEAAERAEAETWLRVEFELEEAGDLGALSPELAGDERLVRGSKLWQLGLYEEAKRELESVRSTHAEDPLASYRLARYFRDLGLYRSSILAAETVLRLADTTVLEAPRLLGRLAYPVYYHDLVLPLASDYGYDPLLQFSLIRQESLFESFVASYAGAQGLSQVMPATGSDIARRLDWPNYNNEDLYRPYVGLAFGAYYLSEQLSHFDGSIYAALSAYNAGPGNAARWYTAAGQDPDLYLETVDYRETRLYIQRIYTGFVAYRHLYTE